MREKKKDGSGWNISTEHAPFITGLQKMLELWMLREVRHAELPNATSTSIIQLLSTPAGVRQWILLDTLDISAGYF
jgi:hypothetical protein